MLLLVFHFFLSKMIYLDEDQVNWNYQHELCSSNPVKVLNNLSASIAAGLIFSFIFFFSSLLRKLNYHFNYIFTACIGKSQLNVLSSYLFQ